MTGWQESAACRGEDPDLFFPTGPTASLVIRQTIERFCRTCPSIVECGQAGRDEQGVWGGMVGGEEGHGDRLRYVRGCRCRSCTRANTDYLKQYRGGIGPGRTHGLAIPSLGERKVVVVNNTRVIPAAIDGRAEALVRLVAAARMADHAAAGRVDLDTAATQMRALLDAADVYMEVV